MTDGYAAEQAADGSGMDVDVIPWLERHWNVDVTVSEYPYHQYAGPEDSEDVARWMDGHGCTDIWTIPNHIRESATYRTDLVGVRVDERAVERRERAVGHLETLTDGEGWGKEQPHLRAFLNLRRDGPMTRREYIADHGLTEPNGQPPGVSERAVEWLGRNGFLTSRGDTAVVDAVDIQPVFAAVHAVELKREPGAWDTALEQVERASVYADYRWVVMSEPTVKRARDHADVFRARGVGLASVSSRSGAVTTHVQPERSPPTEDHDLLSRPYCERWNLSERALARWTDD